MRFHVFLPTKLGRSFLRAFRLHEDTPAISARCLPLQLPLSRASADGALTPVASPGTGGSGKPILPNLQCQPRAATDYVRPATASLQDLCRYVMRGLPAQPALLAWGRACTKKGFFLG